MSQVRAKFMVDSIERTHYSYGGGKPLHTVKLSPVYGNSDPNHENTKFWNATPSGSIQLGTINEDAANSFELGKEYYIDFTLAE